MATNDFLPFSTSGTANVYTNAQYVADPDQANGNQPGLAKSKLVNKALRQCSIISTVVAQYIADITGNNAVDDGTTTTLLANLKNAVSANNTIGTIAALRLTPYTGQQIIYVTGYYTAVDNIGVREYCWDSVSTEADNGGTIIQVTGVVTGRWKMKYSGAVNVKWFGAKGDGVADDTVSINLAISYINNTLGGSIIFDGKYHLGTASGSIQTRFNITSSNITLIFIEGTTFTVKADTSLVQIFNIDGASNINTIGKLHVITEATTTYTTTGTAGARAFVINNNSSANNGNIHIDSIKLTRGAVGLLIVNTNSAVYRTSGITFGDIETIDAAYGVNASHNGDNLSGTTLTTDNAYRSWFCYDVFNHKCDIISNNHHISGTCINISRFSIADGGSTTNTENINLTLSVYNPQTSVTCVTLRHLGDSGPSQIIRGIDIKISTNTLNTGLTAASILNYTSSGGVLTATPFNAITTDIRIDANIQDAASTIYRDICTWAVKPKITFTGSLPISMNDQLIFNDIFDLKVPYPTAWESFVPTIIGTTTSGVGTYSTQSGRYLRIGGTVHFTLYLAWSAHTGTGSMRVSGLPYPSNSSAVSSVYPVWCNNITLTAGNILSAVHGGGTVTIGLQQIPVGGGGISVVPMDVAGDIIITGTYQI